MIRPLRVAVTLEQCWHAVPGGTARAALDGVQALQAHAPEVDQVGVSAHHRRPPAPSWAPSVPVAQLPLPRNVLYESWHWLRRPAVERATGPVDVIHATGMAVPPPSVPLVVTVHDLAFLRDPSRATRRGAVFFRRAIELARRDATLVVCPSEATVRDCADNGFAVDRLRHVPWGIDPRPADASAVAGVRARLGLPGRFVLWTGTIEPRKNLPVLLEAFGDLRGHDDVTLLLAGPKGWHEDIGPLVARLGSRARTVGFLEPEVLRALYAAAEVFCFPSREEGFGLPVLEAMAQGTPVVTSAGTATEEVAGDAGVLVDPADVGALTAALDRLLTDGSERERLGAAGRRRASSFSWARTAEGLRSAYLEAAA